MNIPSNFLELPTNTNYTNYNRSLFETTIENILRPNNKFYRVSINSITSYSQPSPSIIPTLMPSVKPTPLSQRTSLPTCVPTSQPSSRPSITPSTQPSSQPSRRPTSQPSSQPIGHPTSHPTPVARRRRLLMGLHNKFVPPAHDSILTSTHSSDSFVDTIDTSNFHLDTILSEHLFGTGF